MHWPWRIFVIKRVSTQEEETSTTRLPAEKHSDQSEPLINDIYKNNDVPRDRMSCGKSLKFFLISCPLLIALVVFSLALTVTVLFLSIYHPTTAQHKEQAHRVMVKPCGSSPEEARRNGCIFDVISFCWQAPQCYDAELSKEFKDTNDLEWFLLPNRTQPLSYEQIITGDHTGLYVDWGYHLRHCTAMWKKLHRAVLGGKGKQAIDGYIAPYEHTEHCEHILLGDRGIALDTINTVIIVKYPDCGIQ